MGASCRRQSGPQPLPKPRPSLPSFLPFTNRGAGDWGVVCWGLAWKGPERQEPSRVVRDGRVFALEKAAGIKAKSAGALDTPGDATCILMHTHAYPQGAPSHPSWVGFGQRDLKTTGTKASPPRPAPTPPTNHLWHKGLTCPLSGVFTPQGEGGHSLVLLRLHGLASGGHGARHVPPMASSPSDATPSARARG